MLIYNCASHFVWPGANGLLEEVFVDWVSKMIWCAKRSQGNRFRSPVWCQMVICFFSIYLFFGHLSAAPNCSLNHYLIWLFLLGKMWTTFSVFMSEQIMCHFKGELIWNLTLLSICLIKCLPRNICFQEVRSSALSGLKTTWVPLSCFGVSDPFLLASFSPVVLPFMCMCYVLSMIRT